MNIAVAYYSSQGGRKNNEDYVIIRQRNTSVVAVVCDGLGGHENGEVASKIAANTLIELCEKESLSPSNMQRAFERANEQVYINSESSNMRTTAAMLWIDGEDAIIGNIGDTRIYQIRGGQIISQSRDHSIAYLDYLQDNISYDEIRKSKDRNKLTRSLGCDDDIKVEISAINVLPGDTFIICTDGFWEYIYEEEMLAIIDNFNEATDLLEQMKNRVIKNSMDKGDNHTAAVITIS